MAIQDWTVSIMDLSWMVHNDNLSLEGFDLLWWLVSSVRCNITSLDFFNWDILNIESNIVSWNSFSHLFMMHFDWFTFTSDWNRCKSDVHSWFQDSSFDSSDWDSSNTTNLINILQWKSQWLICWSLWWGDIIQSVEQGLSLIPWTDLIWFLHHVISYPSWNRDEWDVLRVISNLLQESTSFSDDFLDSYLSVVDSLLINLVDTDNHLFDSQSESQQSMFSSLSILWNTSFKLTNWWSNHQQSTISLWSTSNHVLNEISMSWGINDSERILIGFKLP